MDRTQTILLSINIIATTNVIFKTLGTSCMNLFDIYIAIGLLYLTIYHSYKK